MCTDIRIHIKKNIVGGLTEPRVVSFGCCGDAMHIDYLRMIKGTILNKCRWMKGARLRASFTVENSVIIPLFTIIIVTLVLTGLDMHDALILKSVGFQAAMKQEQEGELSTSYLSDAASAASAKSMRRTVTSSEITDAVSEMKVKDNDPRKFIRQMYALSSI